MDYGDNYWGLYRDYYRDPFPHSLLSTRQLCLCSSGGSARSQLLHGLVGLALTSAIQAWCGDVSGLGIMVPGALGNTQFVLGKRQQKKRSMFFQFWMAVLLRYS